MNDENDSQPKELGRNYSTIRLTADPNYGEAFTQQHIQMSS